jgi:hypothetical protein
MPEIELAIVIETRATKAKPRMRTTKVSALLRHGKERQVGFQTQSICFQLDVLGEREIGSPRVDK